MIGSSRNTFLRKNSWGALYFFNTFICVDCSEKLKNLRGKNPKKSRDWIVAKKERRRRQGRWVSRVEIVFFLCLSEMKLITKIYRAFKVLNNQTNNINQHIL